MLCYVMQCNVRMSVLLKVFLLVRSPTIDLFKGTRGKRSSCQLDCLRKVSCQLSGSPSGDTWHRCQINILFKHLAGRLSWKVLTRDIWISNTSQYISNKNWTKYIMPHWTYHMNLPPIQEHIQGPLRPAVTSSEGHMMWDMIWYQDMMTSSSPIWKLQKWRTTEKNCHWSTWICKSKIVRRSKHWSQTMVPILRSKALWLFDQKQKTTWHRLGFTGGTSKPLHGGRFGTGIHSPVPAGGDGVGW